jgi:hypothetical protein
MKLYTWLALKLFQIVQDRFVICIKVKLGSIGIYTYYIKQLS